MRKRGIYTVSLLVLVGSLFLPLGVFKVLAASVVLLFYPGFLLSQYLVKDHSKAFLVSPVVGASFWVVAFYMLSGFELVRAEFVVVVSLVSAVLLDVKGTYPRLQKWMILLGACIAFSSLYFYQWNTQLIPPLDDVKIHTYFVVNIENLHALPKDYSMYTEIPHLTYPLGYHALLAVIKELSGQHLFPAVTLSTWFLLLWTPICFYMLASQVGEKSAVFAAFSFSFLSIFFHRLEQTGTYPNLLSLEIFVLSLYALKNVLDDFSLKKTIITSLLMAAAIEIHIYAVLLYAPLLALYGLYLLKRDITSLTCIALVVFFLGLFVIPYGIRFTIHTPHEEELHILREWYNINSLSSTEKLFTALSSISPVLLLLSMISLSAKEKDIILLFLLVSILIIPFLSMLTIDYPGWHLVPPNRFLNFIFIPLCIYSGRGIMHLRSRAGTKNIVFILVVIAVVLHFTDAFYPWGWIPGVSEINPPDDMAVIQFMKTLPPDSVILNVDMWYNPSQWIPSVAERKIFLPPFSFHGGDGCIYYLKTPEKLQDLSQFLKDYNSPDAVSFLKKYSIDFVFITSSKQCITGEEINVESFLNSPYYTLKYQKGESYLFKVDIWD